jgi:NADPH:quinone reductase-like Zn-dependent oxidoreductase
MKAVLLTGHGGLEKLEYREDVPTPEPAEGEVLIAVDAAGINNTDIWTREGAYGTEDDPATTIGWRRGNPMRSPRIQGADIVGRIVGAGGGVNASRIGERVIVDNALYSGGEEGLVDSGLIGSERDGGFAERPTYKEGPDANRFQSHQAERRGMLGVEQYAPGGHLQVLRDLPLRREVLLGRLFGALSSEAS